MPEIRLKNVYKYFDSVQVFDGIDLTIPDGKFTVFVGASGCGKSTLLRMIAGLEEVSGGDIYFDDLRVNDIPASKRGAAMVFQSYALYPNMTVYKNLAFGLKIAKFSRAQIDEKIIKTAEMLQIDPLLNRRPAELSGGQRQRVAIGRAIVRDPKVCLLDEPLSNLDAALRTQMRRELTKLHQTISATMIYVTHDQIEAMTMGDQIVVLNEGRIEQSGPPMEVYRHPANQFVACFLGTPKMNIIPIEILSRGDRKIDLGLGRDIRLAVPLEQGSPSFQKTPACLGIRPEHITPGDPEQSALKGTVQDIEHRGSRSLLYVELADGQVWVVETSPDTVWRAKDPVGLFVSMDKLHFFDREGNAVIL